MQRVPHEEDATFFSYTINPRTLNGVTMYPFTPWITLIIGNYREISGTFTAHSPPPSLFLLSSVRFLWSRKLRNCGIWDCIIRQTLLVSRQSFLLLTLAVKCWRSCTVICSSVHLNQSRPNTSAFCRFVYVSILYARVFICALAVWSASSH